MPYTSHPENPERHCLYTVGGPFDLRAPGVGWAHAGYAQRFGYHGLAVFEGPNLPREQAFLNDAVFRYTTRYNQIVYAEVNRRYPHWLEEYRRSLR